MTPRIDGPADGNPFALEKLLAFAESKPADETYPAANPCRCALAQYVKSHGGKVSNSRYIIGGKCFHPISERRPGRRPLPEEAGLAAYYYDGPHTFGKFAARLRTALAARRAGP